MEKKLNEQEMKTLGRTIAILFWGYIFYNINVEDPMEPDDVIFFFLGGILITVLTARGLKEFRQDFLSRKAPVYFWGEAKEIFREGLIDPMRCANPSTVGEYIFYMPRRIILGFFFILLELGIPLVRLCGWLLVPGCLLGMLYYIVNYLCKALA